MLYAFHPRPTTSCGAALASARRSLATAIRSRCARSFTGPTAEDSVPVDAWMAEHFSQAPFRTNSTMTSPVFKPS